MKVLITSFIVLLLIATTTERGTFSSYSYYTSPAEEPVEPEEPEEPEPTLMMEEDIYYERLIEMAKEHFFNYSKYPLGGKISQIQYEIDMGVYFITPFAFERPDKKKGTATYTTFYQPWSKIFKITDLMITYP